MPFEKKLNIVAGNGYFGKKKKEYTASKITITKTMGTSDVADWNMDSIMKRDIRVSDQIIKTLNKWNNEYLFQSKLQKQMNHQKRTWLVLKNSRRRAGFKG